LSCFRRGRVGRDGWKGIKKLNWNLYLGKLGFLYENGTKIQRERNKFRLKKKKRILLSDLSHTSVAQSKKARKKNEEREGGGVWH